MFSLSHRCAVSARALLQVLTAALVLFASSAGRIHGEEIQVEVGKKSLAQALTEAKAGSTIVLAAGKFEGAAKLPAGVVLRGAGYGRTTIDAGAAPIAVALGGKGGGVEDLTIVSKGSTAVAAEGAQDVTIRRVRVQGGALGILLKKVDGGRVENCIVSGVTVGLSLSEVQGVAVANCTLVGASSTGLSLVDAQASAVFNNIVTDAGTAIVVGGSRKDLAVDYNLYRALYTGKLEGQVSRVSLGPWRDVSGGLDANSVSLDVKFADVDAGNFRPVAVLDWNPALVSTSDWGVAKLGGFDAPAFDIDGSKRVGHVDLGAYEAPPQPAPAPDGKFDIVSEGGTKSAGIFRPDGTLVRYLFQNLPLKPGSYGFRLPARTQMGDPLTAGDYEVRVVESHLAWRYRGITGNTGVSAKRNETDQDHVAYVRFAPDGNLLLGNGWNERGENLRSRDLQTGKAAWAFQGQAGMYGLAVGADKTIYCVREGGTKDGFVLSRIDPATGIPIPWDDGKLAIHAFPASELAGLDELDGSLFLADTHNDKIHISSATKPAWNRAISVPAPAQPAADRKRKLLWVLSGQDKVVALTPDGKTVAEFKGVPRPIMIAVAGDRLAVGSAETGKIHLFDCTQPTDLRPLKTVGRGDGPYGPLLPDRFHFQVGRDAPRPHAGLALDEAGRLALRDASGRVVVLDANGKALYASIAQFGNKPMVAAFKDDERTRVFDSSGRFSWWIDAKAGRWEPDAYWGIPPTERGGNPVVGFFSDAGKKFGIFRAQWPSGKDMQPAILVARFDNYAGRAVLLYSPGPQGSYVVRRDTNGDGLIDAKDGPPQPVLDTAGKAVAWPLIARFMFSPEDGSGDIRTMTGIEDNGVGFVWKRKGLDPAGVPQYEFSRDNILRVKDRKPRSVYDYNQREDFASQSESRLAPDGRLLATFQFGHSPRGMGLSNSGAVDAACFNPNGSLRWLRPLNDYGPVQGIWFMGQGYLTSWGHQAEWIGLDENGLDLGHLGFPEAAEWTGMWVDHPDQYRTFQGNDGNTHVLVGDYMLNCTHWLTLDHVSDSKHGRFPFTVGADAARRLAFAPVKAYEPIPRPAPPRVVIRKLNAPLPIDGDIAKWRAAGITPQILITPATASGAISGPKDASAVIRLAYEGQNLYVQVLRFDDVVTMHQPFSKSHLQDTVEIMINGFFDGFQWSVSNFTDTGPAMVRRRFFANNLQEITDPKHAPCVVKVLDNAKDVSERSLLETMYGIDMSGCRVIVTEFKLPLDKTTYRGSEQLLFPVRSGGTFWLGFLIDDNDVPGADVQDLLTWPASYGTFNPKEDGAIAVFE